MLYYLFFLWLTIKFSFVDTIFFLYIVNIIWIYYTLINIKLEAVQVIAFYLTITLLFLQENATFALKRAHVRYFINKLTQDTRENEITGINKHVHINNGGLNLDKDKLR